MMKEMVEKMITYGANVVICQKGIDDLFQHFLAKKNILAVYTVVKLSVLVKGEKLYRDGSKN